MSVDCARSKSPRRKPYISYRQSQMSEKNSEIGMYVREKFEIKDSSLKSLSRVESDVRDTFPLHAIV